MSDLSFLDPPIEVAANSPRLDMIMGRLRANGLRPYAGKAPLDFGSSDPLLIDLSSVSRETIERCARACMMGLKRQLIVLDVSEVGLSLSDAMTLQRDSDLIHLRGRLAALSRRDARHREVASRLQTASDLGAKILALDPDASPHLLYLGDGSSTFLALQGALKERGVKVTAALSLMTAKEYMTTTRFTAALVDLSPTALDGTSFMDWTTPEGSVSGLPLFALTSPREHLTPAQAGALSHAAELISCHISTGEMAKQIEHLARRYLATAPIAPSVTLASSVVDVSTGFFSRRFLETHLARQMKDADTMNETLCMLTLRVSVHVDRTQMKALADCIRPLLRETDCPALLGTGVIGVSLPMTPYRGGVQLAERIVAMVQRIPALAGLGINWRVVEKRAYHTASTFLNAGTTGPFMRGRAA